MSASFELICLLCLPPAPLAPNALLLSPLHAAQAAAASDPSQPTLPSVTPNAARTTASLGERWSLRDGRELSLFLTPSPEHCAPLMAMVF